jgi:hypothetical protein
MVISAKGGGAGGTQQLREQNLERLTITRNLDHRAERYNGRRGKDNAITLANKSRASGALAGARAAPASAITVSRNAGFFPERN